MDKMLKEESKKSEWKTNVWEFFKPTKRKIIFTLVLLFPFILQFFLLNFCEYTSQASEFGDAPSYNKCGSLYSNLIEPLVVFIILIPGIIVFIPYILLSNSGISLSDFVFGGTDSFPPWAIFLIGYLILLIFFYLISCILSLFKDKIFNKKIFFFMLFILFLSCGGFFIILGNDHLPELVLILIACSILLSVCYSILYIVLWCTDRLLSLISSSKNKSHSLANKQKKKKFNKKIFLFTLFIIFLINLSQKSPHFSV